MLGGLSSSHPAWPPPTIGILHTGAGKPQSLAQGNHARSRRCRGRGQQSLKLSDMEANRGSGKGCQAEKSIQTMLRHMVEEIGPSRVGGFGTSE